MIDAVAADYIDEVAFVAVAGRSSLDATRAKAPQLFSENLAWGLDDAIWESYAIPGQPATVLVVDGKIADKWFGAIGEDELRSKLDWLVTLV